MANLSIPYFYMLIGLPASGKSTIAKDLIKSSKDHITLSSDEIRKELYGDETIQDNPEKVFELMQKRAVDALNNNKDVIYDATNIRRKNRKHLLRNLPRCHKIAVIIWAKYETCVQRDSKRERTVGENVIHRMLRNFQPPYFDEGWNSIKTVYTDEQYNSRDYHEWVNCEHDNPHHNNTVAEHTHQVCREAIDFKLDKDISDCGCTLFIAAHLHDIGKKLTKSFTNARGEKTDIAHYYDHHNVGSYLALGYADINEMTTRQKMLIVWLINAHMEPFFESKYYKNLTGKERKLLDALHQCDIKGA